MYVCMYIRNTHAPNGAQKRNVIKDQGQRDMIPIPASSFFLLHWRQKLRPHRSVLGIRGPRCRDHEKSPTPSTCIPALRHGCVTPPQVEASCTSRRGFLCQVLAEGPPLSGLIHAGRTLRPGSRSKQSVCTEKRPVVALCWPPC